jgi:hypothetical protein
MPTIAINLGNPALQIRESGPAMELYTPGRSLEIKIDRRTDGSLIKFWAQRGIASSDELYWRFANGALQISDNFHDAAAQVSPKHREIDPIAVVDHFLYRTVPGERTYLKGINRLGAGSQLSWRLDESPVVRGPSPIHADRSTNFLDDIECFLMAEIAAAAAGPITNMLSGGVDSTLIQSFLSQDSTSISATIDCPEFSMETDYALAASKLLGTNHHIVHVNERSWLEDVVDAISVLGLPPHHLQTALIHRVFDAPFTRFMTGENADTLFGLSAASIKASAPLWTRSGFKQFIKNVIPITFVDPRRHPQLHALRCHPTSTGSFAATFGLCSDLDLMLQVFGTKQVQASVAHRIDYTIERIGSDIPKGVDGQLHLAHWVDFYCDGTLSLWRQLGFGRGKELAAPFGTTAAVRTALGIPAGRRYAAKGRIKYLLKDLLRRRVPRYDVDKPKGHSGLPLSRFADDGLFDSLMYVYPTPPYLEEVSRALSRSTAVRAFPETRWNLFTLSVWHHKIISNESLGPHRTSRYFEIS